MISAIVASTTQAPGYTTNTDFTGVSGEACKIQLDTAPAARRWQPT